MSCYSMLLMILFYMYCAQVSPEKGLTLKGPLMTKWAEELSSDKVHDQYPRPQCQRDNWMSLNGWWQCKAPSEEEEALPADESSMVPTPPLPPPPPPPPPPVVDHATPIQTSGMAIASLVMGIAGWTLLPLVGSILAIVFGYAARRDIRRWPDALAGEGMAIAGLVLGWIMVGLSVIGLCLGAFALCFLVGVFGSTTGY